MRLSEIKNILTNLQELHFVDHSHGTCCLDNPL